MRPAQIDLEVRRMAVPKLKATRNATTLNYSPEKSVDKTSIDHKVRVRQLLHQIGYRYDPPATPDPDFDNALHEWMVTKVQPALHWDQRKLAALEDQGSQVNIRAYPLGDRELLMIMSKLTVLAIAIDDSLEDEAMYEHMALFSHRMYVGQSQPSGTILPIYEECIREMSDYYEKDAVLRNIGVAPWIAYVDAALLEKRIVTVDEELRASPFDTGYNRLVEHRKGGEASLNHAKEVRLSSMKLEAEAVRFPHFLRQKTAIAESYAAAIFKANRAQELPLTRYIKAIPDIAFTIEIMNDLLSFHKEEMEGEEFNLVQLLTQSIRRQQTLLGTTDWDVNDTIDLLCDQVKESFHRVDVLLRLADFDNSVAGEAEEDDDVDEAIDRQVARQWRGWRDGYITWHLESTRYQLDFLSEFLNH
ncbi:hypothetical protein GLOTRDRAFT_96364 [Gloeophyllum trabeum ATCC 11539]|uniref:Terpenoid synthase n=1 Tax=Gloeophyllum trabeum (strain ATCC 11539 / FP-39264 / Madison 617) TaxID=670483 RepID=S7PVV3_GLOTA|nr:uncharacterized protein GLOTRDRAFT_96364 [Gloeophyllum trabeum ATCC 11539]EPQ51648.1 hypothetical protein GLOTRDRAFT_96364 [Gloeophyllum trabeum ATCC 11539]